MSIIKRNRLSREDKQVLVELVEEEVLAHQNGKLVRLTSNLEWASMLQVADSTIYRYLRIINSSLREYRRKKYKTKPDCYLTRFEDILKVVKKYNKI